ncbi:MAG: hypothetical protein BroJett009_16880 [Armatimonadota bacterium]|nr:MAG: hypothetical protein BroJett009_16880 [Armatimonadota bacterium]
MWEGISRPFAATAIINKSPPGSSTIEIKKVERSCEKTSANGSGCLNCVKSGDHIGEGKTEKGKKDKHDQRETGGHVEEWRRDILGLRPRKAWFDNNEQYRQHDARDKSAPKDPRGHIIVSKEYPKQWPIYIHYKNKVEPLGA